MRPKWHFEAQQMYDTGLYTYQELADHFGKGDRTSAYVACLTDEQYAEKIRRINERRRQAK